MRGSRVYRHGGKRFAALFAAALLVLVGFGTQAAKAALTFNFTGTVPTNVQAGFDAAAGRWESMLNDNITINITIGFSALPPGVLGSTSSNHQTFSYSSVRSAIISDATSTDDSTVAANLPSGSSIPIYINRTADNPNGAGSATPYLDNDGGANNTTMRLTRANAKALGLITGTDAAEDAAITFSSDFAFDFDPTDGIDFDKIDFVGVATHEIGHSLGFTSGVDALDINSDGTPYYYNDDAFTYVKTLDLLRYSSDSAALGAIDWTAGTSDKYLSLDGGQSYVDGLQFSEGRTWGDGNQASHWKADDITGTTIGIMDPTTGYGQLDAITNNDERALDVIGYDLNTTLPPITTTTFGTLGGGGGGGGGTMPEPTCLLFLATLGCAVYATGRRTEDRSQKSRII